MTRVILGDIAISQTGPFGSQLHEEDYVSKGTPIVTVEHLGDTNFTHQNLPFVSEADTKRLSKYILIEGDIVFSRVGSIDRNVYVDKNHEGWMFSGRCIRVRADKNKVNPKYLSYYFKQNSFKKMMMNLAVGATMPSLNTKIMNSIELDLLPRENQDKIANILSAIDDKIQINNKINQELEVMAKALYDYWFVQFDFPDQNGNPYKSSGGKMVYNPELKREIPEGWGVEKLGELAQFKNGINYEKTSSGSEKVKIINVRNISSSTIFINQTDLDEIFLENDKSTNFIVNEGMILITRSGIPGATRLVSELESKTVYSGFIIASEVNDLINKNLIFYYLKNVEEVLKNQSAGTIMKNISQSVLTDMTVSLPSQNVLLKFNSIIDNLLEQMKNVQRQNQELTQLRDWLLPMLMNGQVKV
ncbi:restriction endonuclease subunit S [Streptococcus vestibularis]|uniref:restriction endonuclease subunit S n=1 Tax=Streptococcus vestibularis TaxID=1343 RepID=UPI000E44E8D5|nr:restriction endonuclease subunit S [Streptococcus vestibularis]RGM54726.1 restriction endonuclease subunit S [Streptococcus vestibularis]